MTLPLVILFPIFASFLSLFFKKESALIILNIFVIISVLLLLANDYFLPNYNMIEDNFIDMWEMPWIPYLGISIDLRLDSLSFAMLFFTGLTSLIGLYVSTYQEKENKSLYYSFYMLTYAALNGIFLSFDLFLFFIFWELMIIPLYLMTLFFGGVKKRSAGAIFLLMTQASGLLLLSGIIILANETRFLGQNVSFNYDRFLQSDLPLGLEIIISIMFLVPFLVKLAIFPFHIWLTKLFIFAPPGVLFLGVLIKTGIYGIFRFFLPFFPKSTYLLSETMFTLGTITIFYGAILAFSQKDVRKILAYLTISHMGLLLIGLFSFHEQTDYASFYLSFAQGFSLAGILLIINCWQSHGVSMELQEPKGMLFWAPRSSWYMLFFFMALVGIPGLFTFIGEFLILYGSFYAFGTASIFVLAGLLLGLVLIMRLAHLLLFKKQHKPYIIKDLSIKEKAILGAMALAIIGLGIYPQPMFHLFFDRSEIKEQYERD